MTTPDLEDRLPGVLHDLAAGVHAPATLDVTHAVHHRSAALRHRRRRVRAGVGGGLVAVAVIAGGLWVAGTGDDPRSDVSTDPADGEGEGDGNGSVSPIPGVPVGEPGEAPALTIEHPDVRVVAASDREQPGAGDRGPRADTTGGVTWQVFRRPGDYAGPLVMVGSGTDPTALEEMFLYALWDRRATAGEDVRSVEVLGRPALLVGATGPEPELLWLHTTSAAVDLHLPTADPATLDALIAGIHELTPDEWSTLQTAVADNP